MFSTETSFGYFQPILDVFEIQIEASFSHQQLNQFLNYGLLVVILFLRQNVGSLCRFSSKLLVASRQDHLIEICKTKIAIFVVTVELNQEQQVFSLEFVAKVIGRILADECI